MRTAAPIVGERTLLLATVGVYAVVAYSVVQRTSELAVRVALGATARDVMWLVMKRGLVQLGVGLALGIAVAYGTGRLLSGVLGGGATEPNMVLAVIVLMSAVALAACYWPARSATRLDPVVALRCE